MNLAFIDVDCPEPLDPSALEQRPLGGTESSLFRIALGLSLVPGFHITIAQHNRTEPLDLSPSLRLVPYFHGRPVPGRPDVVVALRSFKILPKLRRLHPHARLHLWTHCFPGTRWKTLADVVRETDSDIIAVSEALRHDLVRLLRHRLPSSQAAARVHTLWNPVAAQLPFPPAAPDPDKLVFFSSPHKGLDEVLRHFTAARVRFPKLKLHLADPGYWRGGSAEFPLGVVPHGPLPPAEIHRHVAEALCVFYPQARFAETFGLVFAEANALGTPVIAHELGAAREVLDRGGEGQLIDCRDPHQVVETLAGWRNGSRPKVRAFPGFSLHAVLEDWLRLLQPAASQRPAA